MARLFKRDWRIRIQTLEIVGLDVAFEVEKSTKREPNKCSLAVYNLTADHRREIEALSVARGRGRISVEIEAGYSDQKGLIFRGDLRTAKTSRDGPDYVTKLEGEDGGRSVLWSRINRSFPPGTRVDQVVRACASAMGVGAGNVDELATGARLDAGGTVFAEGTVLSGSAARELDQILRSVGLRYSIQDGNLQILRLGQPLQATAVRLAVDSGLVGVPEVDPNGTVSATALLIPDVYPGRKVQIATRDLEGFYRVERAKYVGESSGDPWYVEIEAKPL